MHWPMLIARNLLGLCIIALGIFLSLPGIPGQGILTILVGVMVLDFPGKRWLEGKLIGRPRFGVGLWSLVICLELPLLFKGGELWMLRRRAEQLEAELAGLVI